MRAPAERAIDLCNGGLMAFAGTSALRNPRADRQRQSQRRILSDRCGRHRPRHGLARPSSIETEEDDVRGINTKAQLAETEAVLQQRLRKAALDAGVTLVAPETVFLSPTPSSAATW